MSRLSNDDLQTLEAAHTLWPLSQGESKRLLDEIFALQRDLWLMYRAQCADAALGMHDEGCNRCHSSDGEPHTRCQLGQQLSDQDFEASTACLYILKDIHKPLHPVPA